MVDSLAIKRTRRTDTLACFDNRIEDEQLMYGALARLMREGGLGMLVLVRYSILPGKSLSIPHCSSQALSLNPDKFQDTS